MRQAVPTAALVMAIAALSMLSACTERGPTDLDRLATMMTGSFSSQAQSEADTNFFDIRLEMVPIWTDTIDPGDGVYLYVEQAASGSLDKPYRQRVYHVTDEGDGLFRSMVFSLPEPEKEIGAWRLDNPLSDLSPSDLEARDGCAVFLRREADGTFAGRTHEKDCTSSLRGASYATSEITIRSDRIESWDRGWDDQDQQVWGAETGGYIFLKIE